MSDKIIRVGESIIQHGKENNRVYLMKLSMNDMPDIIEGIDGLAMEHEYTKVFAKIPCVAKDSFMNDGYIQEAYIPKFYNNDQDCCFLGKFFTEQRRKEVDSYKVKEILNKARSKKPLSHKLDPKYLIRKATPKDTIEMAKLYKIVFKTYPFPIHDEDYLLHTLENDVVYFGVWHDGTLVALSSSELYRDESNAEMTDFATIPEYRGKNLSLNLLAEMEKELKQRNIHTAYTIARAYSFGMNITFAKAGYAFAGTLTNNTNISGNIESMNVWYKPMI